MILSIPGKPKEVVMLKPRVSAGAQRLFLRLTVYLFPVIVALGSVAASAQQNNLVGQWRGVFRGATMPITITIVIQPNGQYSQLAVSGTVQTMQSGPYKLVAPNTIVFSVNSWEPKTMQVYHATGTTGGYYTAQPTTKPPGATDKYTFKGPNTMILTDELMGGSITMTRVP
jgi:hypothetical protein